MCRTWIVALLVASLSLISSQANAEHQRRPENHQAFAVDFWDYVKDNYQGWQNVLALPDSVPASELGANAQIYANKEAISSQDGFGSIYVAEYRKDDRPVAYAAMYRAKKGINKEQQDWYVLYYLADGTPVKTSADRAMFDRDGFFTKVIDGRVWVLKLNSPELAAIVHGEGPEKHVTLPGAGPGRVTLKSADRETLQEYLATKPGFVTKIVDGRLWVVASNTELASQVAEGEFPEKHITKIGAGPNRMTIKSVDSETINSYLTGKRGFETVFDEDGRLWVFKTDSEDWKTFQAEGFPEKHVTRIGAGPNRETIKSPAPESITEYVIQQPGFATKIVDGRLWVVRIDSPEYTEFRKAGSLEKHVTKIGVGPMGMTVKSSDPETIEMYLKFFN